MLLKITEHCSMGCTHCLSDCKPDKTHMDWDTFNQSINFIKKYSDSIHCVVMSGGEPTEHPEFVKYIKHMIKEFDKFTFVPVTVVTTNGSWIVKNFQEFKDLYDQLRLYKRAKVLWQITNVPEYYPEVFKETDYTISKLKKMKDVSFDTKLEAIYPQGRAKENNLEWKSLAPKCFNIRSIASSTDSFKNTLMYLTLYNKSCTPTIEYDGTLKVGESKLCPKCSDIWKSDINILNDIRNFKCKGCEGPISKLSEEALRIIK